MLTRRTRLGRTAILAAVTGAALSALAPIAASAHSYRHHHHHWGPGAAIGAAIGTGLAAAAASNAYAYYGGPVYYGGPAYYYGPPYPYGEYPYQRRGGNNPYEFCALNTTWDCR
jgi:hypothetical protein